MSRRRILMGLIGKNIMGSLSPALFADAFETTGIESWTWMFPAGGTRLPFARASDTHLRLGLSFEELPGVDVAAACFASAANNATPVVKVERGGPETPFLQLAS